MFPATYFAPRYFAPAYWPKVGVTATTYNQIRVGAARASGATIAARAGRTGITAQAGVARVTARTSLTEDP